MNKRRKRFVGMGVLLIVFVLGFTGCDWIKGVLGMEEDDPNPTPPSSPPEEPKIHLTLYVSETVSEDSAEVAGTAGNPFGTIQDALAAVAKAYDDDTAWKDAVKAWQDAVSEGGSPPNPGKAISAEIVLLDEIESGQISIAEAGDTTYPPLILRDSPGTPGTLTLNTQGTLITVGAGVNLTLGGSLNLVGLSMSKNGGTNDNNASLVRVEAGGNLTLADKAVIRDNTNANDDTYGGGVFAAGTFTMSGGVIGGNQSMDPGGGVGIDRDSGVFDKTGGIIYGDANNDPDDGDETDNTNTNSVDSPVDGGHAVAVTDYDGDLSYGHRRNLTVWEGEKLYWPLNLYPDGTPNNWVDPPQEDD
jgi:hypothetical protein